MNDEIVVDDVRWRWIKGYEGTYLISETGQIRSVDRVVNCSNGQVRRRKGRVLKSYPTGSGQPSVVLCADGESSTQVVCRLVAAAFLPPPEPGCDEVSHKDCNRLNNHLENLEWSSHSHVCQRALAAEVWTPAKGENSGGAKLTEAEVREIRRLYATYTTSQREIASKFDVALSLVHGIIHRKAWKHI